MRRSGLVLLTAALLGGCGGSSTDSASRIRGSTLRVYMSGPERGASSSAARAAMAGAEMALQEHGAQLGRYRIALSVLDDSTPQSDGWDPNQTTANARLAAQDLHTVGYIGDFDSGASAISIPILNRAGVPQVSPSGGAVGLTSAGPGASPGEPAKYYPTGRRTFARVVPTDAVEASAEVSLQQRLGCRAAFVLQDDEVDGEDAAISYVLAARSAGLRVGVQSFQRQALDYTSLARSVAQARPDCVLLDAADEHSAARVAVQVARALPAVRLFASSALDDPRFTEAARGGIPVWLDRRVLVFSPGLAAGGYPAAGRAFLASYARRYGPPPPQAIFGYEAMSLLLHAIAVATDHGRDGAERSKVVAAIFATRERHSVLGTYSIDSDGDTTLHRFGVWRLAGGRPVFWLRFG